MAIALGEPFPGPTDLLLSVVAGVAGIVGLLLLYGALASGRMGLVAPVSGVLAAALPVVAGTLLEGSAGIARTAGIALGILAVVVVARPSADGSGRDGALRGIAAGCGFGCYAIVVGAISPGHVWFPLAIARVVAFAVVVGAIAVRREPWRVARGAFPLVLVTGIADGLGNAAFFLAAQAGRLDVAAVLSALYPVTTVVLAALVLRERVDRTHAGGIALALGSIVLIAAG